MTTRICIIIEADQISPNQRIYIKEAFHYLENTLGKSHIRWQEEQL